MELKIKFLKWSAGLPVAMINQKTAKKMGLQETGRITLKTLSKYPKEISTLADTVDERIVKENEIIVSSETRKRIGLKIGQKIDVNIATPTKSLLFIKKKLDGKKLSKREIFKIIKDVVNNSLSEPEVALFVSAIYSKGMDFKETIYLIKAILKSGNSFKWKSKYVVDKHCIGGVAGNRTTPLVVSICAAAGLSFPKTSSKSITSAAGTADVIEAVAKIEFKPLELKKLMKKSNAFIVWGGSLDLVPADSKIIKVEKELSIDPTAQLLASILAKKFAVGSKYILIDIPYGPSSKVTRKKALELKHHFEKLGKYFRKKLKVVLTDGKQPIGNGVGPILELIDIIKVLDPKEKGPEDLQEKSLFLAGEILEMTNYVKKGKGIDKAKEILYSGLAFKKFKQIIKAQKGNLKGLEPAKFKKDIFSKKSGKIIEINNKKINTLARLAGCPADKSSGCYLYFHVGDSLKKGDKLITIYSESKVRLNESLKLHKTINPIKIK
ncbi:thymidine phosphorylase [Candidatus Pacearchaeota archaeon]|nr:thymidine phosphorylase [Candidatus Pacearchaeota archaeon]